MRLPIVAAALLCAALTLPTAAASAAPAGWDATPLVVPDSAADFISVGPVAETAADGAIWAAWCETPTGEPTQLAVRRISPEGEVGALRVLSTTVPGGFNCGLALARTGADAMRVVYPSADGDRLDLRRLTPSATGAAAVVYDRSVDDGDGADNNGPAASAPLQLLAGPGDTAWVLYRRVNGFSIPRIEARLIASDDAIGPVAQVAYGPYEAAAAVNPQDGSLVAVVPGQSQGLVTAVPVSTGATVGGAVVVRPSNPPLNPPASPFASTTNPAIGIDAGGIATAGWQLEVNGSPRIVQVRRLNATAMTTLGGAPTSLDDGLATDYNQYGPTIAVTPGGAAAAGWYETTSFADSNNAIVRAFAPGNLEDVGVVGPKQQLDGVGRAASVSDLIPGSGNLVTAFEFGATLNSQADGCRVATLDASTGGLVGAAEQLAPGNCYATGPSDDAYGLFAAWDGTDGAIRLLRKPDAAPVCADGAPVSVTAGGTATLQLPCTGWRPVRQITTAPAKGTLGAVDQAAGTVSYTAGDAAGSDSITFTGGNGAGQSAPRSVAITVTAKPVVPAGGSPGGGGGAGAGGTGGSGTPAADRTAPTISAVALRPASVRRSKLRAPTLRFSVSEAASVTVTLERLAPGRRVKGRCVTTPAPTPRVPGVRCTSAVRVSRLTRSGAAGPTSLKIALKRRGAALPAGSYRLTITAKDAAGNAARPATAKLRIR